MPAGSEGDKLAGQMNQMNQPVQVRAPLSSARPLRYLAIGISYTEKYVGGTVDARLTTDSVMYDE